MIIDRRKNGEKERNEWYLLILQAKTLKITKLLQLQNQREHNYWHYQGELTTTIFLLVPFFKEKWNEILFLCNGLNGWQIWMIMNFLFVFQQAFYSMICLLLVWSNLALVWVIVVINLANFYCCSLSIFLKGLRIMLEGQNYFWSNVIFTIFSQQILCDKLLLVGKKWCSIEPKIKSVV